MEDYDKSREILPGVRMTLDKEREFQRTFRGVIHQEEGLDPYKTLDELREQMSNELGEDYPSTINGISWHQPLRKSLIEIEHGLESDPVTHRVYDNGWVESHTYHFCSASVGIRCAYDLEFYIENKR